MTGPEFPQLFREFAAEIGPPRSKCAFDLNYGGVAIACAQGRYHILHARSVDDGELFGFVFNLVGYPDKYQTTLHGQLDMVFLKPEYRKGWNAIRMLAENEAHLRKLKVKRILVASPARFKNKTGLSTRRLFQFMGYKPLEIVYEKYV